jgi:hypothetical protein
VSIADDLELTKLVTLTPGCISHQEFARPPIPRPMLATMELDGGIAFVVAEQVEGSAISLIAPSGLPPTTGAIGEVIVFDRLLDASERQAIMLQLKKKWGVPDGAEETQVIEPGKPEDVQRLAEQLEEIERGKP